MNQTLLIRTGLALLVCAACGGAPRETADTATSKQPTPATSPTWAVRPDSFGPVPLGVPITQAAAALGDSTLGATTTGECGVMRPLTLPAGTSLMYIREGTTLTIERADVDTTGILTAEGVGVGDTEARVREVYGDRARVEPHKYVPQGHNLVVTSPSDTMHRIVFETDGQRVVKYHAGRRPTVDLVERCG